ncbi:hypothetical protein BVH03_17700 [Pseudomonas sp. PA15(2017)]|uniref:hypothetical protein n=1 Tax=Pseudomonas sp. PA15(2017) TaxID=1932111 RepID=UPI00095FEE71|nr:hypothetical protein [Pseudomonas sp. PA15(2017)]OLU25488.1 hypothetical protein BVH03_17700 [Pseudomonas sp. PA15(2017)]
MKTANLVAFLAAARSGQFLEVDSAVLEQYDLDGSVLHLTVDELADHLVALHTQMQAERLQAELQIHNQSLLKIEQLQREVETQRAKLQHEKDWADSQIQALTYKCEQYEAILPGLSQGNTRWMSFRTWWWVIGLLFLALWAFKSDYAVDSLIFSIGWIGSYSGVFLGKLFRFLGQPLRELIRMPALRCHAPRLERKAQQPFRVL